MYRHPTIQKLVDASKLPPLAKARFSLPAKPVTSARYIHVRHKPTQTELDRMGFGTVISFVPGHIDLNLSAADITLAKTDFDPDLKDHPKLSEVMARLGLDDKLTIGHAPALATNLKRVWKTISRTGVDYNNIEFKAQPWYADYFATKSKDLKSNDLGNLRPAHLSLLYKICRDQLQLNYSLGGQEKAPPDALWTLEEFINYFMTGIAPAGQDNCVDFIKRCLEALAGYEAPSSPGLRAFQYQLGFARQPEDLVELAVAYFKPNAEGFLSFAAQPEKMSQEEEEDWRVTLNSLPGDAHLDAFKKSANYAAFAKAFGGSQEVFDAIAAAMHGDNSFFDDAFASPALLAWGVEFFRRLGEGLDQCTGLAGLAGVLFFKDTYTGHITHVSTAGFSRSGKLSISHHESITIAEKPTMQDGLAIGTLGVPSASYNTEGLHNRLQNRFPDKHIKRDELPIMKSYAATGGPMAVFTKLEDFDAFEAFNLQMATQGAAAFGRQWLYGVDPNQKLAELAAAIKAGKVHLTPLKLAMLRCDRVLAVHPKLPAPGAKGDFTPGLYTNNCARLTLLALLAGRATVLKDVRYSEEMDLVDVGRILWSAGLMPNTDPEVWNRMQLAGYFYNKEKGQVERHPGSFLALGQLSGWSNAAPGTPGTYPPDVDRAPPTNPEADAKARQDGDARMADLIRKNQQTFLDQLGPKAAPPTLPWVVRHVSHVKESALIEAHLNALSADDRYSRFRTAAPVSTLMNSICKGPDDDCFGVFDPTGKNMVAFGTLSLRVKGATPTLVLGVSVVPEARNKGVGKAYMQWAMARARNRGVRRMGVDYATSNKAVKQLLQALGKPVVIGTYNAEEEAEMAMPEADGASHLLEATHLHISSSWSKK